MIEEGKVKFGEYETYYRIVGKEYKKTPLLMLHGGPGSTHNSFEVLDKFASIDERPLIMYDQLGCGLSSIPDDKPELYCKETWVKELINLREKLNLKEVHMMGHSWGGMLLIIYLTDYNPEGVLSATLSSTLSSAKLWAMETHRLLKYLSKEDQKVIKAAERSGNYESEEFKKAASDYLKMTVADYSKTAKSTPSCLKRSRNSGSVAYKTAWGPSEFRPSGNLKDYDYTEKMKKITCPVLLMSGTDDESTPLQNLIMFNSLDTKKEWKLLRGVRHMTYFEKNGEYIRNLKHFLDRCD